MAGELSGIQIGESFGTYSSKINNLKNKYTLAFNQNAKQNGNESQFTLFQKETHIPAGNGYKELIKYSEYSQPQHVNSVIFENNLQYGSYGKNEEQLENFDYVIDRKNNTFALDLDGDHKIGTGEIFKGQLDFYAYKKAKEEGNLNKYKSYIK